MKKTLNNECENSKKTLLVVEDNELLRRELCEILSPDYDIITAESGEAAADLLSGECADVSLAIINNSIGVAESNTAMPAQNGCDKLKNIPTIIILSENSSAAGNFCRINAADYITVPLNGNTVRRRVKNTLLLYEKPSLFDLDDEKFSRLFDKLIKISDKNKSAVSPVCADRDLVTGLYSRKSARKIIEKELNLRKNESYMMILLDIDKLKNVNDYYGRAVGDRVLIDFANKIDESLGDDGVCARIGGDEFMIYLRLRSNAFNKAGELYDTLCGGVGACAATANFGCSICPDDGAMYDELYNKADVALHSAKESQTPICFYSANLPDFPHIHTPIDQNPDHTTALNGVLPA